MPTVVGAFCCNALAFIMRSAYDPFGGGFEAAAGGANLEETDASLLDPDFAACFTPTAVEVEDRRVLGVVDAATGLAEVLGLTGI